MKILLVKPHYPTIQLSPPLGLMYLFSSLKQQRPDCEVKLVDLRLYQQPEQMFSQIMRNWEPDVVAFTLVNIGDMAAVEHLSKITKQMNPGVHICCGGPYPTSTPGDFNRSNYIDSIVRGEGEMVFPELVGAIVNGNMEGIGLKGVSVRQLGGTLAVPERSDFIENLDSLPFPDWKAIDFHTYSKRPQVNGFLKGKLYMSIFTSRGCPYQCAFCHNTFGKKARLRSPGNVVSEIECLVRNYGVDEIQVFDDIFNIDRQRAIDICNLIIEKGLKIHISFPNGLRGDIIDEEVIIKLKEAGTYSMAFAIESAVPRVQKLIRKNINIERVEQNLKLAARHGIMTRTFFMLGFPTETVVEMKETARYAIKLQTHSISVTVVAPVKGSELYDIALREAGSSNVGSVIGPTSYYSRENFYKRTTDFDVQRLVRNTYLRFFLHPIRLFRFLAHMPRKLNYLSQIKARLQNVIGTK